jgi:uncharacterized circularly permuted ATP-grasp superfamily protein/uncharacterized alpha-E superfamily protein
MTNDGERDKTATRNWWNGLRSWYTPAAGIRPDSPAFDALTTATGSEQQVDPVMTVAASKLSVSSVAADYASSGPHDELRVADGSLAAQWQPVIAHLDSLNELQRLERVDRINRGVRETGIAHDVFADPARNLQPWRLDLMPLVFSAQAWAEVEAAVIQRSRLMEALLADIYGGQSTLQRGIIPAELIFSDPSYLRACQHVTPSAGRIQFFAADLARGPDGRWRVVDTHVETPAGIAYALANRTVLTHVVGDMFSASKAVRLAPFFQQLQDALAKRAKRPDPIIALLTPGPRHNDFFSHAYLARYLGCLLVEGADLRAENGHVYLKTLDGLQAIDVIIRCVSGAAADPLELDPSGFLGPVGLVQALRQQPDLVVNALGTAIAENRGLGSYLPALCKDLLGEELAVWDITKWWLGDAAVRETVIGDLDRYFIRQAFEQTARPGRAAPGRDPSKMDAAARVALVAEIESNGATLVAEEKTQLGTAPAYGPNGLHATPFAIRVFATAIPGGFAVMPGGLAMTVDPGQSMALTAPDGASRDVWILSDAPQPVFKSLWRTNRDAAQIQRSPGDLPSQVADNLFWLGRYTEQTDWTFRVLRTCLTRIESDFNTRQPLPFARQTLTNLLERDGAAPISLPTGASEPGVIAHLAHTLLTTTQHAGGLPQTLGHVHRIASLTRDRLSVEAWRTLNAFYIDRQWQAGVLPETIGQSLDLIDAGLAAISAFNGLTHENMTRNFGWSFLDMGRRMSRALNLAHMLGTTLPNVPTDGEEAAGLLFALELADSFITYRSRYRLNPAIAPVLDLLIVDETNPRSMGFQLAALATHIDTLPQAGRSGGRTVVQRTALAMLNDTRLADVALLAATDGTGNRVALRTMTDAHIQHLHELTDALSRRYFSVVEKEPKWARARSQMAP